MQVIPTRDAGHRARLAGSGWCVIGLGSNLGDRRESLDQAVRGLAQLGTVERLSNVYETEPVGPVAQADFLNAAVRLASGLSPFALLEGLLAIEQRSGRVRTLRWGPRELDLDLLWIPGVVLADEALEVPHPRLTERAFALLPLLEVAPEATDPRTGRGYQTLAAGMEQSGLRRVDSSLSWKARVLGPAPGATV